MKYGPLKCCICKQPISGNGHNPDPVKQHPERCCDACNGNVVIPERIKLWKRNDKNHPH